jgi:Sulfotransferase family
MSADQTLASVRQRARSELLVFIHIFKTAGTSIKQNLKEHFGEASVSFLNDGIVDDMHFEERVGEVVAQHNAAAMAGHFQFARISEALYYAGESRKIIYFSFIRDPLQRLISAYNYFHNTSDEKWHREARSMGIEGFYEFLLEADRELCLNHQCRFLSANAEPFFESARDNVERNFAFVGLTENLRAAGNAARTRLGFALDSDTKLNTVARVIDLPTLKKSTVDFLESLIEEDRKLYTHMARSWARG